MEDTYLWNRESDVRSMALLPASVVVLLISVGVVAGADGSRRLIQYGVVGVAAGISLAFIGTHNNGEAALRPVRAALAGDSEIGDYLPRSRPTFAAWLGLSIGSSIFTFAVMAAMVAMAFNRGSQSPVLAVVIAGALTLVIGGVPITVFAMLSPTFRPIRDLADATERVAAGDYSQRLPVVQDDDLGGCWSRRSTGCNRVWLSGNDFRLRSGPMSTLAWPPAYSNRVMMSSPVSAAK